jgi:PAS domain S-box-containing protein
MNFKKQAEEDRLWLAAIVRSSDDAIISKTLEGVISIWNSGVQRIFGYMVEEATGLLRIQQAPTATGRRGRWPSFVSSKLFDKRSSPRMSERS